MFNRSFLALKLIKNWFFLWGYNSCKCYEILGFFWPKIFNIKDLWLARLCFISDAFCWFLLLVITAKAINGLVVWSYRYFIQFFAAWAYCTSNKSNKVFSHQRCLILCLMYREMYQTIIEMKMPPEQLTCRFHQIYFLKTD